MTRDGKSKKNTNVNVLPKKNYWFGFWLMTRYGLNHRNWYVIHAEVRFRNISRIYRTEGAGIRISLSI